MLPVRGTTCTTVGPARRTRCAVTTTAGRRRPASDPSGKPRSMSTTSPEVSIEPSLVVVAGGVRELQSDLVLLQGANGTGDRFGHGGVVAIGEPTQLVMGAAIDADRCGVA